MPGFPDHFRDIAGFASNGVYYSTPSNEAVKYFDAAIAQAIYHYQDEQMGGFGATTEKMLEADPDFAMGNIMKLSMDTFFTNRTKNEPSRKKLIDFSNKSKSMKLTDLEQRHMEAALLVADEDMIGAMKLYKSIAAKYPLDIYAVHMGYFLALASGQTSELRDIPGSVVKHYNPGVPYYGHLHGKLCFGQGEMGEYQASEINGRLALDHMPLDNWATHALAHNFEESNRSLQGSHFLLNSRPDWTMGSTFSHHIWWHSALFHVQLGEFDEALSLYDEQVGPMTLKDGSNFALSDGSALLLRLHLEGVDVNERVRAQAEKWRQHNEDFVSLFYDGHNCFTSLMAGDKVNSQKLMDNMREFIQGDRKGCNKEVTERLGLPLLEGITAYFDEDYEKAVEHLSPIMSELQQKIQGSKAQKDIFNQILLNAAVKSRNEVNMNLARALLNQRLAQSGNDKHTPLNQRFLDKMLAIHETQG